MRASHFLYLNQRILELLLQPYCVAIVNMQFSTSNGKKNHGGTWHLKVNIGAWTPGFVSISIYLICRTWVLQSHHEASASPIVWHADVPWTSYRAPTYYMTIIYVLACESFYEKYGPNFLALAWVEPSNRSHKDPSFDCSFKISFKTEFTSSGSCNYGWRMFVFRSSGKWETT